VMVSSAPVAADPRDRLLYLARVRATGAAEPTLHAIFGRVFEPALEPLPPTEVAAELGDGLVAVRGLDQLVLALAGCLTGTLQGTLEARHVPSARLEALVSGRVVQREGRVRLASVHADYTLPIAPEHEAAARRALALHEQACPASRSVHGAIDVSWQAVLEKIEDRK